MSSELGQSRREVTDFNGTFGTAGPGEPRGGVLSPSDLNTYLFIYLLIFLSRAKQKVTDSELACEQAHQYLVTKAKTRWLDLSKVRSDRLLGREGSLSKPQAPRAVPPPGPRRREVGRRRCRPHPATPAALQCSSEQVLTFKVDGCLKKTGNYRSCVTGIPGALSGLVQFKNLDEKWETPPHALAHGRERTRENRPPWVAETLGSAPSVQCGHGLGWARRAGLWGPRSLSEARRLRCTKCSRSRRHGVTAHCFEGRLPLSPFGLLCLGLCPAGGSVFAVLPGSRAASARPPVLGRARPLGPPELAGQGR